MNLFLLALGGLLIGIVMLDAFITIFSLRGGGPLTSLLGRVVWKLALTLHGLRPVHGVLSWVGPILLVTIVFVWYALLGLGWYFVFISNTSSVVDSTTLASTDAAEKLYFLGATLSDLGYGDLVPAYFPWTVLSTFAAFTATLLTSAALSYVLPVVSAGGSRREAANSIHNLGRTTGDMVANIWPQGDQSMNDFVLSLLSKIEGFAHKHMSYPVLLYFHSREPDHSITLAVLKLSDALFLVGHGASPEQRPPKGFRHVAENIVREYAALMAKHISSQKKKDHAKAPAHLSLETLQNAGFRTVGEEAFQAALAGYLPLRSQLVAMCIEDGWLDEQQRRIDA